MKTTVDFIFQNDAKRIFDHFTRLLGIRIVFFSADGQELTAGEQRPLCAYCQMLRTSLDYHSTCKKLDWEKQQQAAAEKKMVVYKCHGGMVEAVLPVYTVDNLIGYIMIGQFRTSNRCPKIPRKQWRIRYGNDKLYKAFRNTAYIYPEHLKDVLGLFELLVDSIINRHLIMTKSTTSIEKLISYIDENPLNNLTLSQAAEMMNKSVSAISHEFKNITGKSFKEYIIGRKLDEADKLLVARRDLKIHQIADKVGYSDPYLFSRIYKKHRGYPPTAMKIQNSHLQV